MRKALKVAALGDAGSIVAFRGMNMRCLDIQTADEARQRFRQILEDDDYALVLLSARYAEALRDEIAVAARRTLPAVLLIPDGTEAAGSGSEALREAVRRAVGFDVLKDDAEVLKQMAAEDAGAEEAEAQEKRGEN